MHKMGRHDFFIHEKRENRMCLRTHPILVDLFPAAAVAGQAHQAKDRRL
jgi:hypothetical protein